MLPVMTVLLLAPPFASASEPSPPPPTVPSEPQACERMESDRPNGASTWVQRQRAEGTWHLDAEALTDFPLDAGAKLAVEMPHRLRLSTSVGAMPGGYVDVLNAVVVSAGGYDRDTADVVRGALRSSVVWRTHFGWRPLRKRGWYFEAGYGLLRLDGTVSAPDVLVVAGREDLSDELRAEGFADAVFDVRSTLHMVDVETGWRFLAWDDRLVFRLALGFAGTVGASTRMNTSRALEVSPRVGALVAEGMRDAEDTMDRLYTKYVFSPVFTFSAGYRFF